MEKEEVMTPSVDALRVREFMENKMLNIGRVRVDGDKEATTTWYSVPMGKWPRKLKKGVRTLRDGKPRTKWQRRGQILSAKLWYNLGLTVARVAIVSSLRSMRPHNFKPGGIVAQPTINPCLNKDQSGSASGMVPVQQTDAFLPDGFTIGMKIQNTLELLDLLDEDNICLYFSDPSRAFLLKNESPKAQNVTLLQMPMVVGDTVNG